VIGLLAVVIGAGEVVIGVVGIGPVVIGAEAVVIGLLAVVIGAGEVVNGVVGIGPVVSGTEAVVVIGADVLVIGSVDVVMPVVGHIGRLIWTIFLMSPATTIPNIVPDV